jgi:hypothetical protein
MEVALLSGLQPLRVFRFFLEGGPVPARNADPDKSCALSRTNKETKPS